MKTFLWYKAKTLWNAKPKIAGLVIIPIVYVLLNCLLKVNYATMMSFVGLGIPLMYTYVLFSAGDLFRVNCYIAAGQTSKSMWTANLVFVTVIGLMMSLISQVVCSFVFSKTLKESALFFAFTVCFAPLVAFFVGLSTVHFRNYSKNEVMFASVVAVLNALVFFLPLLSRFVVFRMDMQAALIAAVIGWFGTIVLFFYMNTTDNETLVRNAMKEISAYDKAMLGLDEE